MFQKILFSITILSLFAFPALAEEESIDPGILPDSPFYFLKTLSEDIGTFFTFDVIDKAERYANLAQLRISEVKALAEKNKGDEAEKALERYQKQLNKSLENIDKARERNEEKERERISQLTEKIALNTNKYYAILEDSFDQNQSGIKDKIKDAKDATTNNQIKALKIIVEKKTDKVLEIYQEALKTRLNKIDTGVDYNDLDSADEAVEEYKKYTNFGQEISELAKGIRIGETTVEELIEKATSNSALVLEQVKARVHQEAKVKIQDAVNTTEQVREKVRIRVNQSSQEELNKEEKDDDDESCLTGTCDESDSIQMKQKGKN